MTKGGEGERGGGSGREGKGSNREREKRTWREWRGKCKRRKVGKGEGYGIGGKRREKVKDGMWGRRRADWAEWKGKDGKWES